MDSINIGDTIYLVSTFPTKLLDQNSGREINYINAISLGSDLRIGKLEDNNPVPIDAVAEFNYFSLKGRIYNDKSIPSPNGVQQLTYQEMDSNYELKIGMIPLKKGIYAVGVGNGISAGRKTYKSCEKAAFDISLNNTSQHIYYYQRWRPGYILTESDLKRLYCFKVK